MESKCGDPIEVQIAFFLSNLSTHANACQVVRFCLQKNPKERPNCASLLGKKFLKRDLQPDAIVNELLVHVPVVGEGDVGLERRELGCVADLCWIQLHVALLLFGF